MLKKILKTILQYLLAIMISLVIALLLRIFAVDFYSIPSDSMEPTLQPGDFIVVNKLCYGARVYKNFKFLDDGSEPPTYRVKGFSKVKHNDVIVFNYPYHKRRDTIKMNLSTFYVKRCIALPGDSLCIANGFYKVNGKKGFGNMDNQEMLSSWPGFQGIYRYTISPSYIEPKWDVKNFGPLVIPGKGITLPIDTGNISLTAGLSRSKQGVTSPSVTGGYASTDSLSIPIPSPKTGILWQAIMSSIRRIPATSAWFPKNIW